MLIDFTMKNFKSFKSETSLSAEVGERLSKYRQTNTLKTATTTILKNLLIFGPNGSGKSNLLDGIQKMQTMVLNNPTKVTEPLSVDNFSFDDRSDEKDTVFRMTFSTTQHTFRYGFSYNRKQVTSEKLELVLKTSVKPYFVRNGTTVESSSKLIREINQMTKKNSLLLFTAQQHNDALATEAFTWFAENLIFVGDYAVTPVVSELLGLAQDESIKAQLLTFLHFADFNIVDLEVTEQPAAWSNPAVAPAMMNQLFTVHKKYNENGQLIGKTRLAIARESRGTQKILMIALAFINAELTSNDKTLLFDEFDDSLHLELSQAMIKIFNSQANQNQFILTTHELQLLDSEVRVDQIYLVEKDFKGESDLNAIFDFKDTRHTTRNGISYMKRYLEGRFGATPIIDSDRMLAALTKKVKSPNESGD